MNHQAHDRCVSNNVCAHGQADPTGEDPKPAQGDGVYEREDRTEWPRRITVQVPISKDGRSRDDGYNTPPLRFDNIQEQTAENKLIEKSGQAPFPSVRTSSA